MAEHIDRVLRFNISNKYVFQYAALYPTPNLRNGWTSRSRTDGDLTQTDGDLEYELIQRICAGDKHDYYSLSQPYERSLFAIAYGVLGNAALPSGGISR